MAENFADTEPRVEQQSILIALIIVLLLHSWSTPRQIEVMYQSVLSKEESTHKTNELHSD
jgi:hypothetical protein